jgi:hypothetical protein
VTENSPEIRSRLFLQLPDHPRVQQGTRRYALARMSIHHRQMLY